MDFRFDEKQRALRATVARFCASRLEVETIRERDGRPTDRSAWRALAELGVLALLVPDADDGASVGAVEAAVVFEQLGAHLVGGPILWTTLGAPYVKGAATGERLLLPNYLLKRAWVLEHVFGNGDAHAWSLGAALEGALA